MYFTNINLNTINDKHKKINDKKLKVSSSVKLQKSLLEEMGL